MLARTLLGSAAATLFSVAAAADFSDTVFFGDSLSDTGSFAPFLPPGSGRFTTNPGPVWTENLAAELGTGAAPATFGGTNFAQGGARVTLQPGVPDTNPLTAAAVPVRDQVSAFLAGTGSADPDALYSVWAGANDLFRAIDPTKPEAADPAGYIAATATQLVGEIARLKAAGARYILVATLPDIGATPFGASVGPANAAGITALAGAFNQTLFGTLAAGGSTVIPALQISLQGIEVIPLDTFTLLREVGADPAAYGFANAVAPACGATASLVCSAADFVVPGAEQSFLFADGVHPTTAGHRIISDYALGVLSAPHAISLLAESPLHSRAALFATIQDQTMLGARAPHAGPKVWARAGGGQLRFSSGAASPGASGDPYDFALGVDWRMSSNVVVGAALGLATLDADFSRKRGGYEQDEQTLALYAGYRNGGAHAMLVGAAGDLDYDIKRVVTLGSHRRAMNGSTSGSSVSLGVLAGYDFAAGALMHGPIASLHFQRVRVDGFAERGLASTAMIFRSQERESQIGSVGYQAAYDLGRYLPYARVTLDHDFEDADRDVRARLASLPANSFGLPAFEAGRTYGTATLGVGARFSPALAGNVALTARVDQDDVRAYALRVGLSVGF